MKDTLKKNYSLITGYFLLMCLCFFILFRFGKIESHLILTSLNFPWLDNTMILITNLGSGIFMAGIAIILMLFSLRNALNLMSSFLFSSLVVQMLKHFVFQNIRRPVSVFQDIGIDLRRIESLEYHSSFSFPSGHSATAFALFIGLALLSGNKYIKALFFIIAAITAFSRIYLSQHFLADTMAGSFIGLVSAFGFYYLYSLDRFERFDRPIYHLKSKLNDK